GVPYHWGGNGLSTGDAGNDLLPVVLDPNVHIQESKAATCDIIAGRRPRGPALLQLVERYRARAGITGRSGFEGAGARGATNCTVRSAVSRRRPVPPATTRLAWASSPTPASASAARRARSPARSGTPSRTTG